MTVDLSCGVPVKILDHGYLMFVEKWGSDERIVEAARMSVDKGFLGWESDFVCSLCQHAFSTLEHDCNKCPECNAEGPNRIRAGDEKLLKYLDDHKHATPFEMAGMVIEVQAPIMVFREWHRHRTQSYNEMSARYTPLPDIDYEPTPERCLMVNAKNKQAGAIKGAPVLTHESVLAWLTQLESLYAHSETVYQSGLNRGIPKELARLAVTVGRYSRMRAQANLRNWLGFLTLRMANDAQYEIRMFANAVGNLIAEHYPRTWQLFCRRGPHA